MVQDQPPPPYYEQPYYGQPYYGQAYYEAMSPNIHGPQQYPNPPYISPIAQPIIISNGMVPTQQFVTIRHPTNHCFCFLICLLTGGLSIPCWIYSCITDDS